MKESNNINNFGSSDVVSVLVHLTLVLSVITGTWWGHFVKGRAEQARIKTESLGIQLASLDLKIAGEAKSARSIASTEEVVGAISQDPWGNSYHYKQDPMDPSQMIIWSSGPNGIDDTSLNVIGEDLTAIRQDFLGDDIGSKMKISK